MLNNYISLQNISELTTAISADSIVAPVVELINNPISEKNAVNNLGFILFFICFFVIVSIISSGNKFFISLFSRLYRNNDRHSMFYETLTHESLSKALLCLQTTLLFSIILYCYAVNEFSLSIATLSEMLLFILKTSLLLIVFLLYKFLAYSAIGVIFFKKEAVIQWNNDFFSLISINGILLFLPALALFYVEKLYVFCIYFIALYLILNLFFVFYKIFTLFFYKKQHLLYFILYLCAQEMIPLYLVYRGFVYLITQQGTIWM